MGVMRNDGVMVLMTDSAMMPGKLYVWALKEFGNLVDSESGKGMLIVTQADNLGGKLGVAASSVDVIVSVAHSPGHHSSVWLAEMSRALKPGGVLLVQEPVVRSDLAPEEVVRLGQASPAVQTEGVLQRSLLLAGFSGSAVVDAVDGLGADAGALVKPVAIKVKKPDWETGSAFSLKKTAIKGVVKLNGSNGTHFNGGVPLPGSGVFPWKLPSVDFENDELVDEDSLLTEEDLQMPQVSAEDDCEVGKAGKKACKNCTCGRAEMEMEDEKPQTETKLTVDQIDNPQSACGSCGLGDAFRCNGCPYRGLPAFKLGEKIALPSDLLTVDM